MVSMEDKPYAAELEATYRLKSNNQTGPGLALSINKRNVFYGGETLSMRLQGNYEWQTGYRKSNREVISQSQPRGEGYILQEVPGTDGGIGLLGSCVPSSSLPALRTK